MNFSKYLFIIVSLFFFSNSTYSQLLNFEENFDNNKFFWEVDDNEKFTAKIENGVYSIEVHPKLSSRYFWRDIIIDDERDFIIEAKMRFISGAENNGYGIIWGAKGWHSCNRFYVSGNQYYRADHYEGNKLAEADVPWKKDVNLVNGTGQYNIIRAQKRGEEVNLFVNGTKVGTMKHRRFIGTKVGFYFGKPMKVEIDYLKIYQFGDANINLVENAINGYEKVNLGKNVNSVFSDRTPIISSDGKTLYFIREDTIRDKGWKTEIYYSKLNDNGEWSEAINIGPPLNNKGHNAVVNVSPDGNIIMLSNTYKEDGSAKGSGFSIANKTLDGWEIPREIKIKNYYNKGDYVSSCMSADRKIMIMAITRDDSYGGQDLYVSFEKNGEYTEPMNLGPIINTRYEDITPFLASDNKTLYFSSNGHPGFGSSDIYVTRRLDDTWTNWSKPENLGPEINSEDWDAYFAVSAKGDYAYLVTSSNTFGESDIVRVELSEKSRPTPVILIKGKVLNAKTKKPIFAEIMYENIETGEEVGRALSDPVTGDYQIVLPAGVSYGFRAEKEGFYPINNSLDILSLDEYKEFVYDLLLNPIEIGEAIRLNNIFFDYDKSNLRDESKPELERLINFLNDNPKLSIEIGGHTDNIGNANYNLNLSDQRAKSVKDYLIANGISDSRLKSKGYGLNVPVADNNTDEGRALNRRVEMKILEK